MAIPKNNPQVKNSSSSNSSSSNSNSSNSIVSVDPSQYSVSFTDPVPGPNPAKNFCQLYTFDTKTAKNGDNTLYYMPLPTYNLDNVIGDASNTETCYDEDQLYAKQVSHTCKGKSGQTCPAINGGFLPVGSSENYYAQCGSLPKCSGTLGLIVPGYYIGKDGAGNPQPLNCISYIGQTTGTTEICDPTQMGQIFRITRVTSTGVESKIGLFANLYSRVNKKYLNSSSIQGVTYFNPYEYSGMPCIDTNNLPISGYYTAYDDDPGFNWFLCPSTYYEGSDGSTGFSPQQIISIKGIDVSDYKGKPNIKIGDFFSYLVSQKANALYMAAGNSNLILAPVFTTNTNCLSIPYIAQIMPLSTYNFTLKIEPCLNGNKENCISF